MPDTATVIATQPPLEPLKGSRPSAELRDRSFDLYVDGELVSAAVDVAHAPDGIGLVVTFRTSVGSLDGGTDPETEVAWGGWKPGDSVHLFQPTKVPYPSNGFGQITGVRKPRRAGDPVYFTVRAITPIYDYDADKEVCQANEHALIPATWFRR